MIAVRSIEELLLRLREISEIKRSSIDLRDKPPATVHCKTCGDRGIILQDGVARVCPCVKQRYREKLYKEANLTPEIRGCSFEGFRLDYYEGEHREAALRALQGAKQFVHEYLRNPHVPGILFTGDVGAGKTYLAAAIANFLLDHGVQVLFLVVPDFLDEMRATYHRASGDDQGVDDVTLLKRVRQVEVLILDDLGVHNYTAWTCNKLYSLLNFRLNYQLPVVITTNLSLGELDDVLGERTTSRIVQMCRIYRLSVDKDIRHLKNPRNER
ncbi:MAG: IstB-like ATP-binding protein [Thermoanaerobacterales bacterium 50_218]|nr:MAG: IstB-like ATP-binding protein [Thermoanaerobacterales bacterium 50_218]